MTKERIHIDSDEWYPVLSIETPPEWAPHSYVEIPFQLKTRIRAAFEEFDNVQTILHRLLDNQPSEWEK